MPPVSKWERSWGEERRCSSGVAQMRAPVSQSDHGRALPAQKNSHLSCLPLWTRRCSAWPLRSCRGCMHRAARSQCLQSLVPMRFAVVLVAFAYLSSRGQYRTGKRLRPEIRSHRFTADNAFAVCVEIQDASGRGSNCIDRIHPYECISYRSCARRDCRPASGGERIPYSAGDFRKRACPGDRVCEAARHDCDGIWAAM